MAIDRVGAVSIDRVVVGPIQTNCYVLVGSSGCVVIDPGDEVGAIERVLGGRTPGSIVLTHGHLDHIGALSELASRTGARVCAHALDVGRIEHPETQMDLTGSLGLAAHGAHVDEALEDGSAVIDGDIRLHVIHTPGHTPGGITLTLAGQTGDVEAAFTGDTLFASGIGRTDFEGGSYDQLVTSIRTRLAPLPDACRVYPGHGPASTVAIERQFNPLMAKAR